MRARDSLCVVYGPKTYVIKLKELTDSLKAAGHIYHNL